MNIPKGQVSEYTVNGEFDIQASFKSDEDSKESKTVTLRFVLNGIPVSEIINSSLKDKRINWQVSARKNFNQITDKSVVKVDYRGGRQPVDPKAGYKAWFASISKEEQEAEIASLKAM